MEIFNEIEKYIKYFNIHETKKFQEVTPIKVNVPRINMFLIRFFERLSISNNCSIIFNVNQGYGIIYGREKDANFSKNLINSFQYNLDNFLWKYIYNRNTPFQESHREVNTFTKGWILQIEETLWKGIRRRDFIIPHDHKKLYEAISSIPFKECVLSRIPFSVSNPEIYFTGQDLAKTLDLNKIFEEAKV